MDFYSLPSEDQVAALRELAAMALPSFGMPADSALELVTERENAVFCAQSGGRKLAVRVHRAGYHTDGELRSHAAWAEALNLDGVVHTAPAATSTSGDIVVHYRHDNVPEPRQVTALEWVEGTLLAHSDSPEVAQYERVGALMASLHDHGSTWERPADFEVLSWDESGLLGDDPTWGRFWETELMDADGCAAMAEFREHARSRLKAFGKGPDRFGLVHGDFLPENLLVGGDGRITLLDFDDAGSGWFMFDIATALVVPQMGPDADEITCTFFEGYRSVRDLPDEDVAELPLFLALRAATYVGWMHTRSHTQFAKDMGEIVAIGTLEAVQEVLAQNG